MKTIYRILTCFLICASSKAQVTVSGDFSKSSNIKIDNHLDTYNRIHPSTSFKEPVTNGAGISIVRTLGGIVTKGKADLSKDTYKWDAKAKKFKTDFKPITNQINKIRSNKSKGFKVHQIVLDNPSWDFQRDSKGNFPAGQKDYIISTYGNAMPPVDYNAWSNYLKAAMRHIVTVLGGNENAEKVQYGIGREIGTSGHWTGSKQQFFEFYRVSVEAIQSVLPNAKVGSHFLPKSSPDSYALAFLDYCETNSVDYDFVGLSYYPFYNNADKTNFPSVYAKDFAPVLTNNNWNSSAKLEIHEFALISGINAAGNDFEPAPKKHQNSFLVGLMKTFFQNGMNNLTLWGDGKEYAPASGQILQLVGGTYYKNSKSGSEKSENNFVDAIYSKKGKTHKIMAYNYSAFAGSTSTENINIRATVNVKPGTTYKYRITTFDRDKGTLSTPKFKETKTVGKAGSKTSTIVPQNLTIPTFSFLIYEFEIVGNSKKAESIKDVEINDDALTAFPNPSANGIFQLNRETSWDIYDINGQHILKGNSTAINLASFPKGVYILRAEGKTLKLAF